jgi:hypothetical protein
MFALAAIFFFVWGEDASEGIPRVHLRVRRVLLYDGIEGSEG